MLSFVTPGYAQTADGDVHAAGSHAAEAAAGAHGAFPPFDPSTYLSQLVWLAICFGFLYWLMSKVVLPRMGGILAERDNRIGADLAEAERLKGETDSAVAAYEQALAEARQRSHAIGQEARDLAKAESDAERKRLEAEVNERLVTAEARIAEVKGRAVSEVGVIAREAAEALVETLLGSAASRDEVEAAVGSVLAAQGRA